MKERSSLSQQVRNPLSYAGAILAIGSIVMIVFLLVFEFIGGGITPYLGVLVFVALPILLVIGLILIPVGIVWARTRRAGAEIAPAGPFPILDLNNPTQRKGFLLWAAATLVILAVLAGISYRAYNFMDSVEFCGLVCHAVMKPEYTTYQHSPHARVTCTACHIGPGADWFVRAKVSGLRQVWAVATNSYPRPIPVPIRDLRPARETCETCHWPERFYGDRLRTWTAYLPDQQNTPQQKSMVLRVGGTEQELGYPTGIHWHISADNQITYIPADGSRQKIPWVRLKRPGGQAVEYIATDGSFTPELQAEGERRTMDCMDCHNRPTHHIVPPDRALDAALRSGRIDASLPFIKQKGVQVLSVAYPDEAAATGTIETEITKFYRESQPEVARDKQAAIQQAVSQIQGIYLSNGFPHMKVDYRTYQDNIGHLAAPGCFRCHDNQHKGQNGETIRQDCNLCHTPMQVQQGVGQVQQGVGQVQQGVGGPGGLPGAVVPSAPGSAPPKR